MDKNRERITSVQLATMIISTMIGVSNIALPRFVVMEVGIGAPFTSLLGGGIAFIGLLAILFLGKNFPKKTIIHYNEIILGKLLGRFFSVLIILFFAVLIGLQSRQFAEITAGALLPNTPIQVAIFMILFLCAVTGFQSVSTFALIHFFYMPLIIFPLAILLIPAFSDIEIYHLTPILGNDPTFKEFMSGGLLFTQSIIGYFVITMVIPFMIKPKKCIKSGIWGFWIGCLFIVAVVTMTLAVFGEEEIKKLFWPTLVLSRMVSVPGDILARIDAIMLISWIYGVFTTQFSYYFIVVRGIGELFGYYNYRVISYVTFLVVFVIAMLPQDIYHMYSYILKISFFGLFLTIVYPLILVLLVKIRKKGEFTL